jgi:hypothetical protein
MTRREILAWAAAAVAFLGAARPQLGIAGMPEQISGDRSGVADLSIPRGASASDWRALMGNTEIRQSAAAMSSGGSWAPIRQPAVASSPSTAD